MTVRKRVLIIDDEKDIVDLIAYNLNKEGFETLYAYDGEIALNLASTKKPNLIILDLMLPGITGLEICKLIRKNPLTESIPIIMLTARGDQIDKIIGLEMGADDYITKPFHIKELIARIRAVLRRAEGLAVKEELFSYKGLLIDYSAYEVSIEGKKINLGPTEFKLLKFLTQRPGRVYTRAQLLDHVWGDGTFVEERTVDVHINRLRSAIEKNKKKPLFILTVRGAGYKFTELK